MPYVPPAEFPYENDSSPGEADGDIVFAEIPNHIMAWLQDELPLDIAAAAGTSLDHGSQLTGLGDDDHTQYALADGTRGNFEVANAVANHVVAADPHGDRAYADALVAALTGGLRYMGDIDCSTNPNYPAADQGEFYRVSGDGKIGGASGEDVEVGDTITCLVDLTPSGDQATVGADWNITQYNLSGTVTGPVSSTDGAVALWDGTLGAVLQDGPVLGTAAEADTGDFAAASHTHAASDIVSGQLATARVASGTATSGYVPTADGSGNLVMAAAAAGYTDEQARDAIGTALVAGTGITITVNDGADTITIDASAGSLDELQVALISQVFGG